MQFDRQAGPVRLAARAVRMPGGRLARSIVWESRVVPGKAVNCLSTLTYRAYYGDDIMANTFSAQSIRLFGHLQQYTQENGAWLYIARGFVSGLSS